MTNHIADKGIDQLLLVTVLDLLDQRSTGEVQMDERFRSEAVEELERCLVNRERFRLFMRALDTILERRKPQPTEIGEEAYHSVLNRGLAVLSDRELLRLALDGAQLWALHIGIKEDGGPYWEGRIVRHDRGSGREFRPHETASFVEELPFDFGSNGVH
jgi:hypothetical protein